MTKGSGCESRHSRGVRLYMRRGEASRSPHQSRGGWRRDREGKSRERGEARETRNELGFEV